MEAILKVLSWTLVHSLWQGFLAAFLAAIIISATRKTSAKLRYNLLGGILVLFLSTVLFTFLIEWREQTALTTLSITDSAIGNPTAIAETPLTLVTTISTWLNNNSGLVSLVWLVFFALHCLKLITGLASVQRLRNYKTYSVPEEWRIKLTRLQNKLGMRGTINIFQSELIKVPVALGFLKPVILLPLGLINNLPSQQVEAILLHELGHIRRSDYIFNLCQHVAEAIFFFNPALLWISSLIRQERESCCDEIVLAHTHQKKNYLDALISFQEYSLQHPTYTMAISGKKQYLLNRVKRIITSENKRLNRVEKLVLLSGLILFSAFTYINSEAAIKEPMVTVSVEQVYSMPLYTVPGEGEQPSVLIEQPVKKKINNRNSSYKIETTDIPPVSMVISIKDKFSQLRVDSVPPPLKKNVNPVHTKPAEKKPATDAEKKLGEIIKLKEHIGEQKENIGKSKELLEKSSGKEKDEIMKKIEKERSAIETKRDELEKKREEYDHLKKHEGKGTDKIKEKKWELKDDKNSIAKFNLISDVEVRKVIAFKMVDLKDLKTDQQFKIEGQKISKPTPKTENPKVSDKPGPSGMKNLSRKPVRI